MLYYLFEYLSNNFDFIGEDLIQFTTVRTGAAFILSLVISMLFGGKIIERLRRFQVGETVRDLGLAGQLQKQGTPTMGGIIIVMAILFPCFLFARLDNVYVVLMIFTTLFLFAIGFTDDYIKVFRKNKKGLSGKFKILGQIVVGLVIALTMLYNNNVVIRMEAEKADQEGYRVVERFISKADYDRGTEIALVKTTLTNIPFTKKGGGMKYSDWLWFLGDNADKFAWIVFIPLVIFILTAVSNAANLTDGLDGLATGVSGIIGGVLVVFAYVSSNINFSNYLGVISLPNAQELVIFSACFMGACLGFLWHNSFPAKVFMGDTGSLTLGGIIAALAILLRKEWLIPILCGIFLAENLSVILQVSYFKYTKRKTGEGRRIFKMAPLHHHYQKLGMPEVKIVTRFWLVAILLAVFTIITLKLR
ncbi:MAG: phospho-N-acetylmuramoyl-pentapeptide-transferase [Bacteroidota bacterium]